MRDGLSDGPERASIGLQTAGYARQKIERVRCTGNTHNSSPPTSRTGGPPMTKGLCRADQGTRNFVTKGLESG